MPGKRARERPKRKHVGVVRADMQVVGVTDGNADAVRR